MAKKGFILYNDQKEVVDELTDEQAGKLLKSIYEYNVSGKFSLEGMLKLIFIPFKTSFDRDAIKWEETSKKRSEAGKRGMKSRWKAEEEITNDNNCNQMITSITDSVSVSVKDSVKVKDSVSVSVNNIPNTHDTVFQFAVKEFESLNESDLKKSCKKFFDYYNEKKWKGVNSWQDKLKMWISDDYEDNKIKLKQEKEKYDTRKFFEDECGKLFKYDSKGVKHYV